MSDCGAESQERAEVKRRLRFTRRQRLRSAKEIQRVLRRRATVRDGILRISVCESERSYPRLGIGVSRRLGNAVRRNRQKRRLREAFRLMQYEIRPLDMVCSIQSAEAGVEAFAESLMGLVPMAMASLHRRPPPAGRKRSSGAGGAGS